MEKQQPSELLVNIGGEDLAGSGFEMEEPAWLDEVTVAIPTGEVERAAQ